MKTILSHFYNEEYLLPWWLKHHKQYFDHGIMIDYHSTDRSVEIIKDICPDWTIVTTRNKWFDAQLVDDEITDYESAIDGWKISLNTTEFLHGNFSQLNDIKIQTQILIPSLTIVDNPEKENYPDSNIPLHDQIKTKLQYNIEDRRLRSLHNFNVAYPIGRHFMGDYSESFTIYHYRFAPYNEKSLDRKLQIQNKISDFDKTLGHGKQHLINKENLISMWREYYSQAIGL
jgi:hypothetical protein